MDLINVGIVGGTGYTGVELLRLLCRHPRVRLRTITSRSDAGTSVDTMFPSLRGSVDLRFVEPDPRELAECQIVFFATPNGTAMTMVPELLRAGVRIIDLAADFRLKNADEWARWYKMPHRCPELLNEAVYGLPEVNRAAIRTARLVANPGCYPTAAQLGLLPLVERGLVSLTSLIVDAKSGISGAGRKAEIGSLFGETADGFRAYGMAGHRHTPEISQGLSAIARGEGVDLIFVPHLTPMLRGIHATLYAELLEFPIDLQDIYEERYRNEPFVDVLPRGSHPDTRTVRGSNVCRIAAHVIPSQRRAVVLSVIDNLVKGAAGQALQNMNIMLGFSETTGLEHVALVP